MVQDELQGRVPVIFIHLQPVNGIYQPRNWVAMKEQHRIMSVTRHR